MQEIESEVFQDENISLETLKNKLTKDSLRNLDDLSLAIKESLRISPAIYGKIQVPKKDIEVEGIKIAKGTKVYPCAGVEGMSNAIWKEPTKFVPERFDDTSDWSKTPSGEKRHAQAFLTFGQGQRSCMGEVYVYDHIKVVIVYLLSLYNIEIQGDLPKSDHFYFGCHNDYQVKFTKK